MAFQSMAEVEIFIGDLYLTDSTCFTSDGYGCECFYIGIIRVF